MPDLHIPPLPFDPARAARILEELSGRGFSWRPDQQKLLEGVFGNSPFLGRLALRQPESLARLLTAGQDAALRDAIVRAENIASLDQEAEAMAELRGAKRQAALAIAMADIAGRWSLEQVTTALTRFADAAVKGALRFLLRPTAARHGMSEQDGAALEAQCGLTVLAMGKYGAHELNYSSDIDLIVFYDSRFPYAKRGDTRGAAVDIVRGLVKLLAEITSDGYVFRTDLRLRPDASATQVAISLDAAEAYYESLGQNWERAAMIKARPCAGDPETGKSFQTAIAPFVWRRHLDYAAIEDIHSIKRQIHAHGGHGEIKVAGHNIKLGRGGIREIEFFAQTQQLILGGRNPSLRAAATLDALKALTVAGVIAPEAAAELGACYRALRALEHRLQMIEDEQTHTLPKSEEGLAHIACFMGYEDVAQFSAALTRTMETVQDHYARLFQREADLADVHGNLVFTGVEDDPETLETLRAMGFGAPSQVAAAIRGWHHGRIPAMRSARARELLTPPHTHTHTHTPPPPPPPPPPPQVDPRDPESCWPKPPIPTPPSCNSTASFPTCRRGCSFFPSSWPSRNSSICWPKWWVRRPGWRSIPGACARHPWMRWWMPISWRRSPSPPNWLPTSGASFRALTRSNWMARGALPGKRRSA